MTTTQNLPGFRDFYPDQFALRAHIFATWRAVATRYGFEEWDGPPLEPLELFTRKSGPEIVGQLYNFEDKGGRQVALRPEMTPTLARMVAARANGLKKPIRWFSIPQMFRYERQQRGRLREHFQLNCDLIGEGGPRADAEIIALAIDVMRAFGLGPSDVRVRMSDRRVLHALLMAAGVAEAQLPDAYQAVDKMERGKRDELEKPLRAAGIADEAIKGIWRVAELRGLDSVIAAAETAGAADAGRPLVEAVAALDAMQLAQFVDVDLGIVRGLAYYTGTVFEIFDAGRTLRAICGGGRYDKLLDSLGGVDLPALGFGMGDVVLGELLRTRSALPAPAGSIDVFVAAVTDDDVAPVLGFAHELRDAGIRTEYALAASQNVGKQLKLADARGAKLAVVIGPDDRAQNAVAIKDLVGKSQRSVARDHAVDDIRRSLGTSG